MKKCHHILNTGVVVKGYKNKRGLDSVYFRERVENLSLTFLRPQDLQFSNRTSVDRWVAL